MVFSVIGTDARSARLRELLAADGHVVADAEHPRADLTVYPPAARKGVCYIDREDFAAYNAVPSAEGAIQLAMQHTPRTICGARVLVIGFGRIGRLIAKYTLALGARVTVASRGRAAGFPTVDSGTLSGQLGDFDIVFNTAPVVLLTEPRLRELKNTALVLDLASDPGGADADAARRLGVNLRRELGLPSRVAPESAAEIVRDTLYNIIRERGDSAI